MSLGHYLWKNTAPGKGYGEELDIDVDTLPKTDLPANVILPNVHMEEGSGLIMRCQVPDFYMSPAGQLYHSTYYGGSIK